MGNIYANNFNNYTTKVLNDNQTKIVKKYLISNKFANTAITNNFTMIYMKNIEITPTMLENEFIIYFLSDENFYGKLNFDSFCNKQLVLNYIDSKTKSFTSVSFNDAGKNFHSYRCLTIYNAIKERLQDTFIIFHHLFIVDIAKYIFDLYFDVIFNI